MKKLSLLILVCVVSMIASAQTDSPTLTADSQNIPAPSCVTLFPTSYDFGMVVNQSVSFFLVNNCGYSVTGIEVSSTGSGFAQSLLSSDPCAPALPNNESCEFYVWFQPGLKGIDSQQLNVTEHKVGDPNDLIKQTGNLTGIGTPDVTLSPAGYCNLGTAQGYGKCTITVTNNEVQNVNVTISDPAPPFTQTNTCPVSLPGAESCTITVRFAGSDNHVYSSSIAVNTNSIDGSPGSIILTGCGKMYCK